MEDGGPGPFVWVLTALVAAAIAIGLATRLALLGTGSLWLDELWTLDAVSRSFREMIGARLVSDQSPPLWTALAWVWLQVSGTYDLATMRLLPALFGILAVAAPIIGGARMPQLRPTFLVMGSVMALSLFPLQYSVELRPYAMMIGLGTVATVIWAGLLTAQLPRTGLWIFLFALAGALAGFGHYYGNLLYLSESAVLLVVLIASRARRAIWIHIGWGAVSLVPVVAWYTFTRPGARNEPVAQAPSLGELQTWAAYAFAPVTNAIPGTPPGYPQGGMNLGWVLLGLTLAVLAAAAVSDRLRRPAGEGQRNITVVGMWSAIALLVGLSTAWVASLLMPPSMNTRNLAALLPVLFLGVACACTLPRAARLRWLTASGAVGTWLLAAVLVLAQYGAASLAPPWQQEAGYRAVTRVLLASANERDAPTLVGLKTWWDWNGQWDAAIRAELRDEPALPSDPVGLPIVWVADSQDAEALVVSDGPVIVFSDSHDQRAIELFELAEDRWGPCEIGTYGGPGFGEVDLLRCP